MASTSERSFGARLRKLQDGVEYIRNWNNYSPPRPQESIPELTALIQAIETANTNETTVNIQYNTAVAKRVDLFNRKEGSLDKLLTPIRGAVEAQFGRSGTEAANISSVIKKLRNKKIIKLPANPTDPSVQKTISQSEQSYGSKTQYFTDLVTALSNINGFTTSNANISLAALQAKIAEVTAANNEVATQLQKIRSARNLRDGLYKDLAERMTRIKAYAKSQYGISSMEYKSVIALGI